jgi:ADP-ribosylglycohydrolase
MARPKPGRAVVSPGLLSRAQGSLLGQCAGDALGQQVEFLTPDAIRKSYPEGLRKMEDGGQWQTLAGQPTDDSELALMLARSITTHGRYNPEAAARAYHHWFDQTRPFDVGNTIRRALNAVTADDLRNGFAASAMMRASDVESQANGSLMRIGPLGIYGYRKLTHQLWAMAEQDSALTHPHSVCRQACALFVIAIAHAIGAGVSPRQVFDFVLRQAEAFAVEPALREILAQAEFPVRDAVRNQGWVLIAFHNAFHQLLRASSFEEGVVNTVMLGGDTDTNAAIAGALLGAVHGRDAIPFQWRQMVLSCHPDPVIQPAHPRPQYLWPIDLPVLAENLLLAG